MRRSDFEYELPPELIAQAPLPQRSASRLLCVPADAGGPGAGGGTGPAAAGFLDLQASDLPGQLRAGDLMVFNDTRVLPARLAARRPSGGRCEVMLERPLPDDRALAHLRASNRLRPGDTLLTAGGELRLLEKHAGLWILQLPAPAVGFFEQHGSVPLPPYITRTPGEQDRERYQSLLARVPGAVAAPTASLHFDAPLLARLDALGVERALLTLHVGAGTFQPLRSESLDEHVMHAEWYEVGEGVVEAIGRTRRACRCHWHDRGTRARVGRAGRRRARRRGRRRPAVQHLGRDAAVHPAGVPVPRGGWPADEFPPAGLDAPHAGGCLRRARAHHGGLPARSSTALPFLQLW